MHLSFVVLILFRSLSLSLLGLQRKSLTTSDGNSTTLINNQSTFDFRPDRCKRKISFDFLFLFNDSFILACQYGRIECDFGATCTFEDECQCIFHCNDTEESIRDDSTGIIYPNPCRLTEAQCHSYYQPASKIGMCRNRRRNEKDYVNISIFSRFSMLIDNMFPWVKMSNRWKWFASLLLSEQLQ